MYISYRVKNARACHRVQHAESGKGTFRFNRLINVMSASKCIELLYMASR